MYVSKKDLDTIMELCAFVDGALESADDSILNTVLATIL